MEKPEERCFLFFKSFLSMILLIVWRFFSILQHSRNAEKGRDGRELAVLHNVTTTFIIGKSLTYIQ